MLVAMSLPKLLLKSLTQDKLIKTFRNTIKLNCLCNLFFLFI